MNNEAFHCEECGAPLVETGSTGSVCSKGCGKIHPKLPPTIKRRNHAKVSLGRWTYYGYEVPGHEGTWRKVGKPITRILNEWPKEIPNDGSKILALDGGRVIVLERPHEGERSS